MSKLRFPCPSGLQLTAGTDFVEDAAVEPGPDTLPAPLGEAPVDRLPAQAEHLGSCHHVQPEVATEMIAARASPSPARRRPPLWGRFTSVGGSTRRHSTHHSSGDQPFNQISHELFNGRRPQRSDI